MFGGTYNEDVFSEIQDKVKRMKKKETVLYHNNCQERRNIVYTKTNGRNDDDRNTNNPKLRALWRKILIEWMYYVVDNCTSNKDDGAAAAALQRHAIGAAVYYFDIAITRNLCKSRHDYQLVAATALQLSLKLYNTAVITVEKLLELDDEETSLFTAHDVTTMEFQILHCLDWHLHPPTIYCYLAQYEHLLGAVIPTLSSSTQHLVHNITQLIAEKVTKNEHYLRYRPSLQGYAAMLVTVEILAADDRVMFSQQQHDVVVKQLSRVSCHTTQDTKSSKVLVKITRKIRKSIHHSIRLRALFEREGGAGNTRQSVVAGPSPRTSTSIIMEREETQHYHDDYPDDDAVEERSTTSKSRPNKNTTTARKKKQQPQLSPTCISYVYSADSIIRI